jgi:Phage protein GP46
MSGNITTAASAGAAALDIGLAYSQTAAGCDLVFAGGDIQVDTTPVTGMLMAAGCDARARPEDKLPEDGKAWAQGAPLADLKRGWPGDALDAQGRRNGSRTWIFVERGKAEEATRQGVEGALGEGFDQVSRTYGVPIQLTVRWVAPMILGYKAVSGKVNLNLNQPVAG